MSGSQQPGRQTEAEREGRAHDGSPFIRRSRVQTPRRAAQSRVLIGPWLLPPPANEGFDWMTLDVGGGRPTNDQFFDLRFMFEEFGKEELEQVQSGPAR